MNLSTLTDPNPKPYLDVNCHNINASGNIACDILTANNVINTGAVSATFNALQVTTTVTLTPGFSTSQACNTSIIPSLSFNLSTNIFTCPVAGDYQISLMFNVGNTVAVQTVRASVSVFQGASLHGGIREVTFQSSAGSQRVSFSSTDVFRMNAGETLTYTIQNSGAANIEVTSVQILGFRIL